MIWRGRPVSVVMRPLLSRGALVGVMLLTVVAIGQAAPPQHALLAQSASIRPLTIADLRSDPLPRRADERPPPTPSAEAQTILPRVPVATVRPKPRPPAPPKAAPGTGQWGLINQDRQAAGLAPLLWNTCLANVATGQAARMAAQGYISHANGRTLDLGCHLGARSGENIGFQGGGIHAAGVHAWVKGDAQSRAHNLR